eukprot:TRINITY_DN6636_c0_g1_i1.p1 TRINITY_DN6636_c0_g1~~TRINITY_DN6636_c0_g1_i1.p1  ORF type:complete len:262 (-),score=42.05 TRINITY_DN6636_c0_g1_i1:206-991(-)
MNLQDWIKSTQQNEILLENQEFQMELNFISKLQQLQFNFTIDKAKKRLKQFRKQEFNILISTFVSEEGLDIPFCNQVIMFNNIGNIAQFVQTKGRARQKNSKFILIVPENEEQEQLRLVKKFQSLIETTKTITQDFARKNIYQIKKINSKPKEEEFFEIRFVKDSEALLSSDFSISLIDKFCLSLSDDFYDKQKPKYQYYQIPALGYYCLLQLPIAIKTLQKVFCSELQQTKDEAKQSVTFNTALALYKEGCLNKNLQIPK